MVPPFQVQDEYKHLLRADQNSYGDIVGTRIDEENSGGFVKTSHRLLSQTLQTQSSSVKDRLRAASALPLTKQRELISVSNTVQYGPVLYLPQAAALAVVRLTRMKSLQAFYLARCINGSVALVVGFLALCFARRARFLIFSLLTMPMTLFVMGSISQDALPITGSALFMSIVSRILSSPCRSPSTTENGGLIILLVSLVCGGRSTQII